MSELGPEETTIRLQSVRAMRQPEEATLRLPSISPPSMQEAATLPLHTVRPKGKIAAYLTMRTLRKVPEVTVFFWIIKLMTTALGESTSDYLVHQMSHVKAVLLGGVGFVLALVLQLVIRRYVPWVYWLAVIMVAVFGTMVADVIHIVLGIPYMISASAFALALAIIFAVWHRTEKTLSIHSIDTPRRELFYWATVIATFALGTATGDLTAYTFKFGYFTSGLIFLGLIALPALAFWLLRLNEVLAFWLAYILTRPIGASFADWTGKSLKDGGIGIGNGPVILVLTVLICILVAYLTLTRQDIQSAERVPARDSASG